MYVNSDVSGVVQHPPNHQEKYRQPKVCGIYSWKDNSDQHLHTGMIYKKLVKKPQAVL